VDGFFVPLKKHFKKKANSTFGECFLSRICYYVKKFRTKEGNMKTTRFYAIVAVILLLPVILIGYSKNKESSSGSGAKSSAVGRNWLIKVDKTIPVKEGDETVNHTLVLIARKEGRRNADGIYEGAAYIGSHLDLSPPGKNSCSA